MIAHAATLNASYGELKLPSQVTRAHFSDNSRSISKSSSLTLAGTSARFTRLRSCADSTRPFGVIPSFVALLQSAKATGRHRVGRGAFSSPSNLPLSRRVGIPAALASRTGHTPDEASITPRVTQLSDQRESVFAKLPKNMGGGGLNG